MDAQERDFEAVGSLGPFCDAGLDLELVKSVGLYDGRPHDRFALLANEDRGGRSADLGGLRPEEGCLVGGSIQVG